MTPYFRLPTSGANPNIVITHPTEHVAVLAQRLVRDGASVYVVERTGRPAVEDLVQRALVRRIGSVDDVDADIIIRDPGRPDTMLLDTSDDATGTVTLVGGGPGDIGLLTVAGLDAIKEADVIVCDRLAPLDALDSARADAEVIHVGKIPRGDYTPQEKINELLIEHARKGRHVVRFKGGDNYVFGRGGEEWNDLVDAGISVTVIPGVTSAISVPGLSGIPLTHRSLTQGFVVVSGHVPPGDERGDVPWATLATTNLTLVIMMGVANLKAIADELISSGMPQNIPAACISEGSMPGMTRVTGTLETIADLASTKKIGPPAITVIGDVVTALKENP